MSDHASGVGADLIEVEIINIGSPIRADARGRLDPGATFVSGGGDTITHSIERIAASDIQRGIESICSAVGSALIGAAPDSWSVELNLGFKANAKVPVLMSGEANAALKVTMNWKKSPPILS